MATYKTAIWPILIATAFALISTGTYAGEIGFSAGIFKFNATDFYYPNFYDEIGLRSEINYDSGEKGGSSFRFLFYAYPGDDNIAEFDLEYSYGLRYLPGNWSFKIAQAGGVGLSKLQYPAPYFPTVTHQYLLWARIGGDASINRSFFGRLAVGGGYRFRVLYYMGSDYGAFVSDDGGNPMQILHSPYANLNIGITDAWTITGRGGLEYGGYYDAVFLTPDEKLRPFVDVGFIYSW